MDFSIPEEIVAVGDAIIKFIDREVVPIEEANRELLASERTIFNADGRYADEVLALRRTIRMRSAELGFYNLFAPEILGGDEMGAVAAVSIQEVLHEHVGPGRHLIHPIVLPSPFTNGLSPVLTSLDPSVFALYRDQLASGDKMLCFGLSEPDAGSDVYGMKTRAVRDGDDWLITGTKQWISNAPYADYAMVFAITDPELCRQRKGGITGFLVDVKTPGFNVPRVISVMGHLGSDIGVITLDAVRVRDDHRLGAEGKGLSVAIKGVNKGRVGMAGQMLGLAKWALKQGVEYSKQRQTFGRPIADHQAIQFMLAECAMEIYAAKNMIRNCAWRIDNGLSVEAEISMVKAYSTEMLNRVMDRCIQIHGGMGLTNELRLEDGYRYARSMRIPDGTTEIQKRTIAKRLLSGDLAL
ncbi:MAG: acyl-CoA dehydrogenase [Pseudomonadota bacterium]